MKGLIALLLCVALLLCGCAINDPSEDITTSPTVNNEASFESMDDSELLPYISDQVYSALVSELDQTEYLVEDVQSLYVSKEYLEELDYNTKENIFFGYTISEIVEYFEGASYVFALDEHGQTTVQEVVAYDDTYDRIIKNVAIGAGVILVCATVAILTKNPAAVAGAGKAIKAIFTISSNAAKSGAVLSLKSAAIGGTMASFIEATKTNDVEQVIKAGLLGASESFKWGAIAGTVKGVVDGIRIVGNTHYFPEGTEQAKKYPNGVEFTKAANGKIYPRFEKWAKKTAKFDMPTKDSGLNGNYYHDAKLANAQVGYDQTPPGYTWHHVEDMKTMLLVPQDLHSPHFGGMGHNGGASLIKKLLGTS